MVRCYRAEYMLTLRRPDSARGRGRKGRIESRRAPAIIQLEPGQTYEHQFNLSDYYDLTKLQLGTYQVRFTALLGSLIN